MKITELLTLILIVTLTPFTGSAATLHGTIYDWSTFEPLENTIVKINTTPPQTYVATDGKYSFEVPRGNYQITANHYQNGTIECTASENITITRDGNFVLDILLLPPPIEDPLLDEINLSEPIIVPEEEKKSRESTALILIALFSPPLILFATLLLKRHYRRRVAPEEEPTIEETYERLPEDLQKIIDIITKNGGRMTQKDLRKHFNLSEAKISLMVSDLEERGLINKIKKGRGNILICKR